MNRFDISAQGKSRKRCTYLWCIEKLCQPNSSTATTPAEGALSLAHAGAVVPRGQQEFSGLHFSQHDRRTNLLLITAKVAFFIFSFFCIKYS